MKLKIVFLAALLLPMAAKSEKLYEGFVSPAAEYSMLPFWSWNGKLDPARIRWQIDQMKEKGIDGAFAHARAGLTESQTPYFSDGFWQAMDTAVYHGADVGFHLYLYDEDKWPSGSAGGRTVAANPDEFGKKVLLYKHEELYGPASYPLDRRPQPTMVFAARLSEKGAYDFASQVELTDRVGGTWEVPAGKWGIVSYTLERETAENQPDYLDSTAIARFIEVTHEEYYKRYARFFGNTIPGVFFDEIAANGRSLNGNIFWTDDLLERFKQIKGYDLRNKLPLLLYTDPNLSKAVRNDYFDVVTQLYNRAWFHPYAEWCERHRLFLTGHTAELLVHFKREGDFMQTIGQLQVPGADNEDYRYGHPRMIGFHNPKLISSVANLFDRKRNMVEAMGGGGYVVRPEEYRYGFAMLAAYGVNMFIPHLFHYDTDRPENQADWPATWFYQNPYWKYFKPLATHAARLSYMNTQGSEVCEVAILYPLTELWSNGYNQEVNEAAWRNIQQILIDRQINFNIIDPTSVMNASIDSSTLSLGRGRYKVIVLPETRIIRADVMQKLADFVQQGGKVVAINDIPSQSAGDRTSDDRVANLSTALFGFHHTDLAAREYYQWNDTYTERFREHHGAFFTRRADQLPRMIDRCISPDVEVKSDNRTFLRLMHRRVDNTHTYLMVNDRGTKEHYTLSLRDRGVPVIWSLENGKKYPVTEYREENGRLELTLAFAPRESYYLILEEEESKHRAEEWAPATDLRFYPVETRVKPIEGAWNFQFAPQSLDYRWSDRTEADTMEIPVMQWKTAFNPRSWREVKIEDRFSRLPGVQRYLSGWIGGWIIPYYPGRHIPDIRGGNHLFGKELVLEAEPGNAWLAIASGSGYELRINGQTVASRPVQPNAELFDLGSKLKKGKNRIELKTTNTHGLLAQLDVTFTDGRRLSMGSDSTWQVSGRNNAPEAAFELCAPPMGVWGEVENPLQRVAYPLQVTYRQILPAGAIRLLKPTVNGRYTLKINEKPMTFNGDYLDLPDQKGRLNSVELTVEVTDKTDGLIKPLRVVCQSTPIESLVDWKQLGAPWFSGRALYTKQISIEKELLTSGTRLKLDLGEVDHFAEIWINGQLVKYLPWAPFEADVTDYVRPGNNTVTVVAANLAANKASWNILDDNFKNREAIWWHYGTTSRESEKLRSGLKGPVRLINLSPR